MAPARFVLDLCGVRCPLAWAKAKVRLETLARGTEIDLLDRSRRPLALQAGDVVVLASDGIQTLSQHEILRVVGAFAAEGPAAIAEALIRTVDGARDPFQDNTTVVAVLVR